MANVLFITTVGLLAIAGVIALAIVLARRRPWKSAPSNAINDISDDCPSDPVADIGPGLLNDPTVPDKGSLEKELVPTEPTANSVTEGKDLIKTEAFKPESGLQDFVPPEQITIPSKSEGFPHSPAPSAPTEKYAHIQEPAVVNLTKLGEPSIERRIQREESSPAEPSSANLMSVESPTNGGLKPTQTTAIEVDEKRSAIQVDAGSASQVDVGHDSEQFTVALPSAEDPQTIQTESEPSFKESAEQIVAPSPRKKVIQIHPTDEANQKSHGPKSQPGLAARHERKARVYGPPDISECLNATLDTYNSRYWLEYRKWNRALVAFFLLNSTSGTEVYLTITPRLLVAAWQKAEGVTLQPEEASTHFANAVGKLYEHEVLSQPQGLKVLKCSVLDRSPLCTAFLGLAVLAAYTMRTDGGYSANAYYARLADLLVGHGNTDDSLPFEQDEYYALWAYLQDWLRKHNGAELSLPTRDESARFYVALALSHVPLRQVDTERLPRFFLSAKYGPAEKPPAHQLDAALRHWCAGHRRFTDAGMDAINDKRRPAVLSQIAHELEIWDGAGEDEQGKTTANIELLLEFQNRQPTLSYSARCPAGFPRTFDAQHQMLQSTEGGWYDQKSVSDADGPLLSEGFTWNCESKGTAFALRRSPAKAIALVTQEHSSALMSHGGLSVGGKCAVMCLDQFAVSAAKYLSEACGRQCDPCKPPGFPNGWTLFAGISVRHSKVSPPEGLESLVLDSAVQILCVGGLKVGGAYLKDAPPRICITGLPPGAGEVSIDEKPIVVDSDGFVLNSAPLLDLGFHTISAGNRKRKLEIVDSDLAPGLAVRPIAPGADRPNRKFSTLAATPSGVWEVLGAGIGDIGEPYFIGPMGMLHHCEFQPVWAICCANRRSPKIVFLLEQPRLPQRLSRLLEQKLRSNKKLRKYAARWVSSIRFANHPHARFICADGREAAQCVKEAWDAYKRAARQVARHIRKK